MLRSTKTGDSKSTWKWLKTYTSEGNHCPPWMLYTSSSQPESSTRWFKHFHNTVNKLTSSPSMLRLETSIDFSASLTNSIATSRSPNPHNPHKRSHSTWWSHQNKDGFASVSGILKYSYKEIQKATQNFTNTLGEGSFGTVYKAMMPTGEVVAVKMLGPNSKQGEKEFQTEDVSDQIADEDQRLGTQEQQNEKQDDSNEVPSSNNTGIEMEKDF